MAVRPWITPQEVRDYTDRQSVKDRTDAKLKIDISRAEFYVMKYTGNNFADDTEYPTLPDPVKIAVLLLAELYAGDAAALSQGVGSYQSETFDDYSYTMADTAYKIENLNLDSLLDAYIEGGVEGEMSMRTIGL